MNSINNRRKPTNSTDSDAGSLPCLNSYISNEISNSEASEPLNIPQFPALSVQHRRSSFVLKESVQQLSDRYGLESLGFLTLTFRDHVLSPKEAQRRLNSLFTRVIKPRYGDYVGCMERQKSGRIHYHLLIVVGFDIRTGFDFAGIENRDYSSASPGLRNEWSFWRKTASKYGFGRTELLPVKSNIEAISKYVGKYIAKHMDARQEEDKGVRLVRYSRGARAGTTRFQFHSEGSKEWRRKLAIFAQIVESDTGEKCRNISDLSTILGPKWSYNNRDYILALP